MYTISLPLQLQQQIIPRCFNLLLMTSNEMFLQLRETLWKRRAFGAGEGREDGRDVSLGFEAESFSAVAACVEVA